MKLFCISDLHLEFYQSLEQFHTESKLIWPAADVLILAGDIGSPLSRPDIYREFLKETKTRYAHVILVAGNHEYRDLKNHDRSAVLSLLHMMCEEQGVLVLDRSSVIIEGVKFLGTTLWSQLHPSAATIECGANLPFPNLEEYLTEYAKCVEWLRQEISSHPKNVVITHHLPTAQVMHPKFLRYGVINTAFVTELIPKVLNCEKVVYWFCGHSHESADCQVSPNTRVILNPVGYRGEQRKTLCINETWEI